MKKRLLFSGAFIVVIVLIRVIMGLGPLLPAKVSHVVVGDPLLPQELPKWLFKVRVLPVAGAAQDLNSVPVASAPGRVDLQLRLFGFIPLSHLVVNVIPPVKVIPGGHAIGVLLDARGLVVVGFAELADEKGRRQCPAREAGLSAGDIIVSVNGQSVQSEEQVKMEVQRSGESGREVRLGVKRGDRELIFSVRPLFCPQSGTFRLGLYVRDRAAGIGTLTFYEPQSKFYGALGHAIMAMAREKEAAAVKGRIVQATIQGVRPSRRGQPGEKIGTLEGGNVWGEITGNTPCGIFGPLQEPLVNPLYPQPLPVAMAYQVKRGPAEVLTVLRGNRVQRFAVEILQVMPYNRRDGKGLIIKVTDEELLEQAGGIVQGMSGSPIIQEGKFVGAVTHVFINDPARGYGVLAEWMLMDANLVPQGEEKAA